MKKRGQNRHAAEAARRRAAAAQRVADQKASGAADRERERERALGLVAHYGREMAKNARWQDAAAIKARRAGASWAEIGRALGISKQSAQTRYGVLALSHEEVGTDTTGAMARSRR